MKRVAVIGASGGIGQGLLGALRQRDDIAQIHATRFRADSSALPDRDSDQVPVHWQVLDAADEASVKLWASELDGLDWLINCVGFLHDDRHGPEKSIRHFAADHFHKSMALNTLPTLLLARYVGPLLKRSEAGVFASVSARVGSIEDNGLGGWYSYRASKAALNMALKCLAIEWQRMARSVRVVALHPGTTDTALSAPFQDNVPDGKLFSTEKTAGLLLERIDELHAHSSGRFIAYDGEEIPW